MRKKRTPDPDIKRAVELAGGVAKVALLFGIDRISVYLWMYNGRVPADRCPKLEEACSGAVRCEQMNREIDWAYLRGSTNQKAVARA